MEQTSSHLNYQNLFSSFFKTHLLDTLFNSLNVMEAIFYFLWYQNLLLKIKIQKTNNLVKGIKIILGEWPFNF